MSVPACFFFVLGLGNIKINENNEDNEWKKKLSGGACPERRHVQLPAECVCQGCAHARPHHDRQRARAAATGTNQLKKKKQ